MQAGTGRDAGTPTPDGGATPADAIDRVMQSAARLGVEIDEAAAAEWVAAMATEASGGDLVMDVNTGVYGHRVTMLDFQPEDLARFREMSTIVGFEDRPPQVMTALSISGSAAQSKVNAFPADCDFFERIHIKADSREAACTILGDLMREKALTTASGPGHRLWEVKFGTHQIAGTKGGQKVSKGSPMSWTLEEIRAGQMELILEDGSVKVIPWSDGEIEPGWCKLDWVIADKTRGKLANASNMLDVTWEAPDGTIVPLDGFLDPYFQEVYLESESIPLFSKLVKELSADSVDDYVDTLEHEVWKYTVKEPNFGKAARRMYNVFRMSGRYSEAAYLRELFDEPITALYQVAALVRTLDDAASSGEAFDSETMVAQVDRLIMSAIQALDGPQEAEMVGYLLRLRDSLGTRQAHADREDEMAGISSAAVGAVNDYFERMLRAVPEIQAYLEDVARRAP
ncbi:MAG TPA: hypothetical protein VFX65_09610 [Candidatus Limnocylindrales bacterium]|nr:hypothetical protein [Candidatus Limnocylindrales bacterium]